MDYETLHDVTEIDANPKSPKSYVVAACLAGIFGIVGIHHFYVGRGRHGLFDISLSIIGSGLIFYGARDDVRNSIVVMGVLFLVLDYLHTIYFMYKLIVGEYRDGDGLLIKYPGQK